MRLHNALYAAKNIHVVKDGYYYKDENDILSWYPKNPGKNYGPGTGSKRLLTIYCSSDDWAKIKQER